MTTMPRTQRLTKAYLNEYRRLLRRRIRLYITGKGLFQDKAMAKAIGCTPEKLREHIELQFDAQMSWKNRGGRHGWHLDHCVGLKTARSKRAMLRLCHYLNLQPLHKKENLSKPKTA